MLENRNPEAWERGRRRRGGGVRFQRESIFASACTIVHRLGPEKGLI
jgi:hypothetical protein